MLCARTHSRGETLALAERVGSVLRAGDVVALVGELGAGKTVFAKGIARALGVKDDVVSPTFALVREYDGVDVALVHVDVYRLDHLQELRDAGFDELVGGAAVTVVEWGDRVSPLLPADRLDVVLVHGADRDDDRVVSFEPAGMSWAARRDALAAAVDMQVA
ncbi:MAG TPA: tRNA (adenosine(37)-N6)-threonylcarbamoyltransferase complex ATPase subunit type 1 TsaE [Acidimicrobiia bacterium]